MNEPNFKVGTYKTTVTKDQPWTANPETYTKTVKGQMTDNFAVNYKTKSRPWYIVTHLPTGYRVTTFTYFRQAKAFMRQAEAIPDIATMDLTNARSFAPKLQTIIKYINSFN